VTVAVDAIERARAPLVQVQRVVARVSDAVRAAVRPVERIDAALRRQVAQAQRAAAALGDRERWGLGAQRVWRAGEGWSSRPRSLVDALVDPATPAGARPLIARYLAELTGWWWDLAFPGQAVTEHVLARRGAALLLTAADAMADGQTANIHHAWVKDAQGRRWVGRRMDLPSRALFAEWFFQRLAAHLHQDVRCRNASEGHRAVDWLDPETRLLNAEQGTERRPGPEALLAVRAPDLLATLSVPERETYDHWNESAAAEAARLRISIDAVYQRRARVRRKLAAGRPAP
jgi:hypothetical protein